MGWQVFRGPCYSKGVCVLAWPTRCPLWSLPALSGTLILPWQGQRGTSLDGKGRSNPQHGSGPVHHPRSWLAQVLYCRCVSACRRGMRSCERSHSQNQSLVSGLPSCSYFLPAFLGLSPLHPVLSCLLRPLIMSSLACSFPLILSCASSLTSGRARKKKRRKREVDTGREVFQVLLRPTLT